ncbi:MAG: anhydro-N-acetylmuramic acid kinase [Candidatus Eremiobacteraeota bacterium]|nr:anhydro-N-acetylmuramic acid kinase [Candidatus Eremiobacteraeota bacterium]
MIAIGLMSGTSFDGVDAALVRIVPMAHGYEIETLDFVTRPYDAEVVERLAALLPPHAGSTAEVAELHRRIGEQFGLAARAVAAGTPVDFVASHGQTIWHDGDRSVTLQIGDPFAIREAMRATVCYDFRSGDTAAGGCGAPLVPYVDALLLASEDEERVALNLGGIANLTLLPRGIRRGADGAFDVVAFDTGPANMLMDAFVAERTRGRQRYDRDGELGVRGFVHDRLLEAMLAEPYFAKEPPKSTGRERFGAQFLARYAASLEALELEDGVATLAELTAATVADQIAKRMPAARVLVAGGGARNPALLARLQARLPQARVETTAMMGIDPDAKEAIAFAVLGCETLRGRGANVPRATGASRSVPLGAIAPHDLARLLTRIEAECG